MPSRVEMTTIFLYDYKVVILLDPLLLHKIVSEQEEGEGVAALEHSINKPVPNFKSQFSMMYIIYSNSA